MRSTCETLEYQSQTEFIHSIFHRNSEIRKSYITHFDSNTIAQLNHTSTTFKMWKIIFHFMDLYAHWIHSTVNVQQKVCFRNLNICFGFCWQIKTEFQHWRKLLFSFQPLGHWTAYRQSQFDILFTVIFIALEYLQFYIHRISTYVYRLFGSQLWILNFFNRILL